MEVEQVYQLVNAATQSVLGETEVLAQNLSNVVDIGNSVIGNDAIDNYVKSLVDHIGRVIFVNRVYQGSAPTVLMDAWQYGSICEKITVDELPEAVENDDWNLTDGQDYSPFVFKKPKISAKFFNKRVTFEIDLSITEMQVKSSFSNATQLNSFVSMIYNSVEKSMTVKLDALVMQTVCNMIGQTLHNAYPDADYNTKTTIRAVNLLKMYNDIHGTVLTPETCIITPDFIRFANFQISLYVDRLKKISKLFNVGGKDRFTPRDMLKIIMLSEFKSAGDMYLQSDVFHNELTKLPSGIETVPFWQGSGTDYSFANTSDIHVNIDDGAGGTAEVVASGILAIMFDRDALGVSCLDRRTRSIHAPKGDFYNSFFKMDAGYFNDLNENCVVFFVA